jgi:hypothetical protein
MAQKKCPCKTKKYKPKAYPKARPHPKTVKASSTASRLEQGRIVTNAKGKAK